MAKFVADAILDAALQYIEDNGDRYHVHEGQPTSWAEFNSNKGSGGFRLGGITISATDFTGPADGDTSGRKTTVDAQTGITVDVTGTADHCGIGDIGSTAILMVTTISNSQTVTSGNTMDLTAWDYEIADAT